MVITVLLMLKMKFKSKQVKIKAKYNILKDTQRNKTGKEKF